MSKRKERKLAKKKANEEKALEQQGIAPEAATADQQQMQPAYSAPRASWRKLNNRGPIPVAPPSDFIQLTPIVQPIPLVPYSTQSQPLATFDEYEGEAGMDADFE